MKDRLAGCVLAVCAMAFGQQAATTTAPTGTIEGQVLNGSTGAPLKKVTIRLNSVGGRQTTGTPTMPTVLVRETDEQGHFAFGALDAGKYQLSADRTGFLRQNYGAHKYSGGSTPIVLAKDQHVRDVVFKLSPQSVISGKVLDEDGDPVANIQVQAMKLQYRGGKKQWSQVGNGQTSDIGEYRLPNLDPGRYLVSTNARNLGNFMMQTVSNEALPENPDMVYASTYYPSTLDPTNASPVDVGAGGEVRGVDVRLRKTPAYRVRGRVANMSGGGGRGQIRVSLTPKDGGPPEPAMAVVRPPDNRFEVRGVAPGTYLIQAQLGNGPQMVVAFQEIQVANRHVDGLMLSITPGNEVPGTVKMEGATTPIDMPNLQVFLRPALRLPGVSPRGKVDADLKFVLPNVLPVRYMVMVSGVPDSCYVKSIQFGGQDVPEDGVDITAAAPLEVTLRATAAEVDSAVIDKDGKPVPGAIVALIPKDGPASQIRSQSADENGVVTMKGLKPGEYKLLAWEDVPWGAYQDPEFLKPFESRAQAVKLDDSAKQAVQLKAIPAEEVGQ